MQEKHVIIKIACVIDVNIDSVIVFGGGGVLALTVLVRVVGNDAPLLVAAALGVPDFVGQHSRKMFLQIQLGRPP